MFRDLKVQAMAKEGGAGGTDVRRLKLIWGEGGLWLPGVSQVEFLGRKSVCEGLLSVTPEADR